MRNLTIDSKSNGINVDITTFTTASDRNLVRFEFKKVMYNTTEWVPMIFCLNKGQLNTIIDMLKDVKDANFIGFEIQSHISTTLVSKPSNIQPEPSDYPIIGYGDIELYAYKDVSMGICLKIQNRTTKNEVIIPIDDVFPLYAISDAISLLQLISDRM